MYDKTDVDCLFANCSDPTLTFDQIQARRMRIARQICDVLQPDNPADCVCTIQVSGNALIRVLNAAGAGFNRKSLCEHAHDDAAAVLAGETAEYRSSLELYAIIDQLRDQLAENRMRPAPIPEQPAQNSNLSEDPQEWLARQFEFEWCPECGRDHRHHTAVPLAGNWFARCDLAPVYEGAELVINPEKYPDVTAAFASGEPDGK